jgi:predicted nucleotidyltransferase
VCYQQKKTAPHALQEKLLSQSAYDNLGGVAMLAIEEIKERAKIIANKYNLASLEFFGSYADGTADENSDVDFLVRFAAPVPSIFKVMGLRKELSHSLGLPVDLFTSLSSDPASCACRIRRKSHER